MAALIVIRSNRPRTFAWAAVYSKLARRPRCVPGASSVERRGGCQRRSACWGRAGCVWRVDVGVGGVGGVEGEDEDEGLDVDEDEDVGVVGAEEVNCDWRRRKSVQTLAVCVCVPAVHWGSFFLLSLSLWALSASVSVCRCRCSVVSSGDAGRWRHRGRREAYARRRPPGTLPSLHALRLAAARGHGMMGSRHPGPSDIERESVCVCVCGRPGSTPSARILRPDRRPLARQWLLDGPVKTLPCRRPGSLRVCD